MTRPLPSPKRTQIPASLPSRQEASGKSNQFQRPQSSHGSGSPSHGEGSKMSSPVVEPPLLDASVLVGAVAPVVSVVVPEDGPVDGPVVVSPGVSGPSSAPTGSEQADASSSSDIDGV